MAAPEVFDPLTLIREGAQKFSTRGGRDYGFSTLLALRPSEGYKARVFNAGGGNNTGVTNKTEIIDFSALNPQWAPAADMMHGRAQGAHVVVLCAFVIALAGRRVTGGNRFFCLRARLGRGFVLVGLAGGGASAHQRTQRDCY